MGVPSLLAVSSLAVFLVLSILLPLGLEGIALRPVERENKKSLADEA